MRWKRRERRTERRTTGVLHLVDARDGDGVVLQRKGRGSVRLSVFPVEGRSKTHVARAVQALDEPYKRRIGVSDVERPRRRRRERRTVKLDFRHLEFGRTGTAELAVTLHGDGRPVGKDFKLPDDVVSHVRVAAGDVELFASTRRG